MVGESHKTVSFIQHFLPGLDAGGYQLQVQQQLFDAKGTAVSGTYANTYSFAVKADRFAISQPAKTVNSVFPADCASGEFSAVLPHVLFSQQMFPWVRYPGMTLPNSPPAPGTDTDADVPTWLWVMILDEDDVAACAAAGSALSLMPVTASVADLFSAAALPTEATTTLGSNFSYFDGATDTSGLGLGETLTDSIQIIDVPYTLFAQLVPTISDLQQMAHGRIVNIANQATTAGVQPPGVATTSFGAVFGNRLPQTGRKTYAYLVSLEGGIAALPQQTGPAAQLSVRLAVLKSWSFYSTGESATFVEQLESLNGATLGGAQAPITSLCLPYDGTNVVVGGALGMGYAPLTETLRTGEVTVSWYRGPLAPCVPPAAEFPIPIPDADAATIFDPTTGMFDVSYAAAWTLGRMMALQNTAFAVAYYGWLRSLEQQAYQSIESELIEANFGAALTAVGAQGAAAPGSPLIKRALMALKPKSRS